MDTIEVRLGRVPTVSAALETMQLTAALGFPLPPGGQPEPRTETTELTAAITVLPLMYIGHAELALAERADETRGAASSFAVIGRKDFGSYTVTAAGEALEGAPGLGNTAIVKEVSA